MADAAEESKPPSLAYTVDALCEAIKNNEFSEDKMAVLTEILVETFPELVSGKVCENAVSGMYAYSLDFHRVKVYMEDGKESTDETWKVVKLGMSKESLTNRIVTQCRGYVNKNAWVQPLLPGHDHVLEGIRQTKIKSTYVTSVSFAEFVRMNHLLYPNMVFIAPGLIADEKHVRERFGTRIGKWKLEKECLKHFFDGEFDPRSVAYADGTIQAAGGWKIWLTAREDSPGRADHSPGPSEYFLMRTQDINNCHKRFLAGEKLTTTRKDPTSHYTSMYSPPSTCIIYRHEADLKPLVLVNPGVSSV